MFPLKHLTLASSIKVIPSQAFIGRRAHERKLGSAGTVLWKCTQFSLVNPSTGSITEWWCSDDDLDPTLQRCKNLQVWLRRYARARLAVIWEWKNSMDDLLRARILQPVYAFVRTKGRTRKRRMMDTVVRRGKAGTEAQTWTESRHGASAAAGGGGSQSGVVGGLHDRCAQLGAEVSYLEPRG